MCRGMDLTTAIGEIADEFHSVKVFIHPLIRPKLDQFTGLTDTALARYERFWLHDYFNICPSYALIQPSMKAETIYGSLLMPLAPKDLISRALIQLGEWGYAEPLLLAALVRPGDHLFDVGAYLGTFSLGLAGVAPLGQLTAIEANPAISSLLAENLRLNSPCRARVATVAVAREEGWVQVAVADGDNLGATRFRLAGAGVAALPARSLRQLRDEHGNYDILKLDIEGFEKEALLGDADYIREARPVIFAECNEDAASLGILEALVWLGYAPVYLAYPAFRRDNYKGCSNHFYPIAYEAALLAAAPDRLAHLHASLPGEDIIIRPVDTADALRHALWDTPRWGNVEWFSLSRAELMARLGRCERGEAFASFLQPQPR